MGKLLLKTLLLNAALLHSAGVWALSLNGVTEFGSITKINARSAAVIAEVAVSPGSRVKAGDLLLRFDATPHQARRDQTEARVKGLRPEVSIAELELERALELYDRDSLSEVELKKAENRLAAAQADLQAAEAELRLASYELQQTRITAPAAARVLSVDASAGQYVDPAVSSAALVSLVDARNMKAVAALTPEQWSPSLLNKKATVKFRGKTYTGEVSRIGLGHVQQANGQAAYQVEISFTTDNLIPAHMPVSIEINN